MSAPDEISDGAAALAEQIARIAQERGLTVAVAESLTGGKVACHALHLLRDAATAH